MAEQELESVLDGYNQYIETMFAPEDAVLVGAKEEMAREGVPTIYVSASEGKLLHVLALMVGAKRILEVGTLGGYSTTWLARALPADGTLISLEIDPHHADVARHTLENAGLSDKVEVRVGPALQSMIELNESGAELFDLVFIDADKEPYPQYLEQAIPLTREGGIILGDNTLRSVLDPQTDSGITRYNKAVAANPDLVSILMPVLRPRGTDGLLVSIKRTQSV